VNHASASTRRLTVSALAPIVDGSSRPAGRPMGTWFSRWACLYTDADLVPAKEGPGAVAPSRLLPVHHAA
jgi:hypothetical protein